MKRTSHHPLLIAALTTLLATAATASELAQKARDVMTRNQDSLITVSGLSKMDFGGTGLPIGGLGGESQETSCAGLVIDPTGLTVVSYSALNPMEKLAGAIKIRLSEDDDALKAKTQLSRIQMRLPDGTEIPARLVLKDKELDLAFLVPDPKEGARLPAFSPVKLPSSASAKELDDVVVLARHGKDFGYQPIVTVGHVTSVIKKPRAMYDLSAAARPGAPVFLPEGSLLGLCVTAGGAGESEGGGLGGLLSMEGMEMLVLPASELPKLAEQAKRAAEKKTKETPKEEK